MTIQKYNIKQNLDFIVCLIVIGLGIGWLIGLSVSPVVSIVITSVVGSAAAIIATVNGIEDKNEKDAATGGILLSAHKQISAVPLAVLVFGIGVGSWVGISARNHHWLGSDVESKIQKWTDAGVNKEFVVARLFEAEYPYSPYTKAYLQTLAYTQTVSEAGYDLTSEIDRWKAVGIEPSEIITRLFELEYSSAPQLLSSGAMAQSEPLVGKTVLFSTSAYECTRLLSLIEKQNYSELSKELESSTIKQWRLLPNLIPDPDTLAKIVKEVLCATE